MNKKFLIIAIVVILVLQVSACASNGKLMPPGQMKKIFKTK